MSFFQSRRRKLCGVLFPILLVGCSKKKASDGFASSPIVATVERVLPQHERMWSIAFTPDGQYLATAGVEPAVKIWRVSDGSLVRSLQQPVGATWVRVSADGQYVSSGSYDGIVRLWRITSGALVRSFIGHSKTVWTVAFSPDGHLLASAGEDKVIRIWNLENGKLERELPGHSLTVWAVQFSPDGKLLASGSFDHTVKLWTVDGSAPVRTLNGHTEAVVELAFSPDGHLLASGGDDAQVRIWQVASGRQLRVLNHKFHHVDAVAFSPDGKYLASGGRDKGALGELVQNLFGESHGGGKGETMWLWCVRDGRLLQALSEHSNDVHGIAFSPDGKRMASASEDRSVIIWNLKYRLTNPR